MLFFRDILTTDGRLIDYTINSPFHCEIDGKKNLLLLPGLIDQHVHFRTPGACHKEDWVTGSIAALAGGVTTVFDMPNTTPCCITRKRLQEKQHIIDQQLTKAPCPIRYQLYIGADKHHLEEIEKVQDLAVGVKIFMGSSTGDLLMDDQEAIESAFQAAAKANLPVAVHAENEERLRIRTQKYQTTNPLSHSIIRDETAAVEALEIAVQLAKKYKVQLLALHLSTQKEMEVIRKAKKEGVSIIAETTPHHLFLDTSAYQTLGTCAQMNPPLREPIHHEALWEAIHDGTIDVIGSDHAPHTQEEKNLAYPQSPSGVPGVQTTLALLLSAWEKEMISLQKITDLCRNNLERALNIAPNNDIALVELNPITLHNSQMQSKCGWTPYQGMQVPGVVKYTVCKGRVFKNPVCESMVST